VNPLEFQKAAEAKGKKVLPLSLEMATLSEAIGRDPGNYEGDLPRYAMTPEGIAAWRSRLQFVTMETEALIKESAGVYLTDPLPPRSEAADIHRDATILLGRLARQVSE
jgi:uncharacterized protein YbjT (DUF2867 family)